MPHITTLAEAEEALLALKPVTFAPNLRSPENLPELMAFLGNPQEKYKVVHIAGTSGKTSTSYYTAALLRAAGQRVGLTISPHTEALNERVQINMQPLPEAEFCAEFGRFLEIIKPADIALNYFQAMTAFAFWQFAEQRVDYAVVEVGIGGLADSTNVVAREDKICIINDIDFGHTAILGNTLGEIAANKAGIIQLHNTVFCRQQAEEIMAPIRARAQQKQADLHTITGVSTFDFLPPFQRRNFAMAEAAADFAVQRDGLPALPQAAVELAARTRIPGRLELHRAGDKTIIADAAHNPQEMRALAQTVQQLFPGQATAVLFAPTKGPRQFYQGMAAALPGWAAHSILANYPPDASGRFGSADPAVLAKLVAEQGGEAEIASDPTEAFALLKKRPEPVLVVTGSFYLLNYIRPLLAEASS